MEMKSKPQIIDDSNRVKAIMYTLSAADWSILKAAIDPLNTAPQTLLTTTPGSNNDRVWKGIERGRAHEVG